MQIPVQISVRDSDDPAAIEEKIRKRALRLERYSEDIQRCQVWIEAPHGHHRKGRLYEARIRLTVPDEELVVDGQPQHDDVNVVIRDAFDAARRQLEDYTRRRRGDVKSHRGPIPAIPPAEKEGV